MRKAPNWLRAGVQRFGLREVAYRAAPLLGVKPDSALRQLQHIVKGTRPLSDRYSRALRRVVLGSVAQGEIRKVLDAYGSLSALAEAAARERGITSRAARRHLQRMLAGGRPVSDEWKKTLKALEGNKEEVRKSREKVLKLVGRVGDKDAAETLGVSRQKLRAVLEGRSSLPAEVRERIPAVEQLPARDVFDFERIRQEVEMPSWAESVQTAKPGLRYDYYARVEFHIDVQRVSEEIARTGGGSEYIVQAVEGVGRQYMVKPGLLYLGGHRDPAYEFLLELARRRMQEFERDNPGVRVELAAIIRHRRPVITLSDRLEGRA